MLMPIWWTDHVQSAAQNKRTKPQKVSREILSFLNNKTNKNKKKHYSYEKKKRKEYSADLTQREQDAITENILSFTCGYH